MIAHSLNDLGTRAQLADQSGVLFYETEARVVQSEAPASKGSKKQLKTWKRIVIASAAAVAISTGFASVSWAAPPTTKNNKIIPGKSIGGLHLGTKMSEARRMWSAKERGKCSRLGLFYCSFEEPGLDTEGDIAFGSNDRNGKVKIIYVNNGSPITGGRFGTLYQKYATPEGIRIGSSKSKVRQAYGKRLWVREFYGIISFVLNHPRKIRTEFTFTHGRVYAISVKKGRGY